MTSDDEAFDVFVSYRQAAPDGPWVHGVLVPGLRAAGLAVCVDVEYFRLGRPVVLETERAVEVSRWTLAVLTPAYLESAYTQLESVLAEHLGLERMQDRLVALKREPVTPRLGMRARLWLDMTDDALVAPGLARLARDLRDGAA